MGRKTRRPLSFDLAIIKQMISVSKRFVVASGGTILVVVAVFLLAPSGGRRYLAQSVVIAKPYTNALFARSFETHVIQMTPQVLRLRVMPAFNAMPGLGTPVLTNGVWIRIFVVGATAQDAERVADEAAASVCWTLLTNYGVAGAIIERGHSVRSYSHFHDRFQPAVARFFMQ